ncbi:MAG: hypothetical protein ABFD18_10540 [Syntrophomonas sp.]
MHKNKYLWVLIFISLTMMIFLPACSKKQSASKKPQTSSMGQKPKAPSEIQKIQADIDMLIAELDKNIKQKKASPIEQSAQLEPQGQQGQQGQQGGSTSGNQSQQGQSSGQSKGQEQGGQSSAGQSSGQSSGGQSGQQSQSGMQAQGQENVWQKADKSLKSIHQSWNKLEPEAIKAGLQVKARDDFEKGLEDLTLNVGQQKSEESLMAAVSLYKHFAELAMVFAMPTPPDYFQVKYEIMAAITKAAKEDWLAAQKHLPNIQEHWSSLKIQAQGMDAKLLNQSEYSIHDLMDAITSEQSDLVMIKGEIVMNNLKQLETKFSKMPQGQGQGQNKGQSQSQGQSQGQGQG